MIKSGIWNLSWANSSPEPGVQPPPEPALCSRGSGPAGPRRSPGGPAGGALSPFLLSPEPWSTACTDGDGEAGFAGIVEAGENNNNNKKPTCFYMLAVQSESPHFSQDAALSGPAPTWRWHHKSGKQVESASMLPLAHSWLSAGNSSTKTLSSNLQTESFHCSGPAGPRTWKSFRNPNENGAKAAVLLWVSRGKL